MTTVIGIGNTNYEVQLTSLGQPNLYMEGRVMTRITQDIVGTDYLFTYQIMDLQWNFFAKSGAWWQIVAEPGIVPAGRTPAGWNNFFIVSLYKDGKYSTSQFEIGHEEMEALFKTGTIAELYWSGKVLADGTAAVLDSAFLNITKPDHTSKGPWQIPFSDFAGVASGDDLLMDTSCKHEFNITGSVNGSYFGARQGAGVNDYAQYKNFDIGSETGESSDFKNSKDSNVKYTELAIGVTQELTQTFFL